MKPTRMEVGQAWRVVRGRALAGPELRDSSAVPLRADSDKD